MSTKTLKNTWTAVKGRFRKLVKTSNSETASQAGETTTAGPSAPAIASKGITNLPKESTKDEPASLPEPTAVPTSESSQIRPSDIIPSVVEQKSTANLEVHPTGDIAKRPKGNQAVGNSPSPKAKRQQGLLLWIEARKRLQDSEDWKEFEKVGLKGAFSFESGNAKSLATVDTVMSDLVTAKNKFSEEEWVVTLGQQKIVCREVVGKIVGFLKVTSTLGTALTALDPTHHAGMAWGGVQFFIEVMYCNI